MFDRIDLTNCFNVEIYVRFDEGRDAPIKPGRMRSHTNLSIECNFQFVNEAGGEMGYGPLEKRRWIYLDNSPVADMMRAWCDHLNHGDRDNACVAYNEVPLVAADLASDLDRPYEEEQLRWLAAHLPAKG